MGFEPTTFCLGSRYSTPELHPLVYSLSFNIVPKSRVGNIIGNVPKIDLPQSLPHLEPNWVSEFKLLHQWDTGHPQ